MMSIYVCIMLIISRDIHTLNFCIIFPINLLYGSPWVINIGNILFVAERINQMQISLCCVDISKWEGRLTAFSSGSFCPMRCAPKCDEYNKNSCLLCWGRSSVFYCLDSRCGSLTINSSRPFKGCLILYVVDEILILIIHFYYNFFDLFLLIKYMYIYSKTTCYNTIT